MKYNFKFWITT